MPDFTIVYMAYCQSLDKSTADIGGYEQTGLFDERQWPTCTCPAYKYRRNGTTNFGGHIVPNPCKHIQKAHNLICGWHQLDSSEVQKEEGVCPRCGGPTTFIPVAV